MWKVYNPEWWDTFQGPYEAYSSTYDSLVSELEYIGIFLGCAWNVRTFAVYTNERFVK